MWVVALLLPRQLHERVEIGAHHRVLSRAFRHALQPPQLLARLGEHLVRHAGFLDRLLKVRELLGVVVTLAELLLDGLHLLAQKKLTLPVFHRLARLLVDAVR